MPNLITKLKALVSKKHFIRYNAAKLIKALNVVKVVVNNPATEIAVALTPTKVDDNVLRYVKVVLPVVISKLDLYNKLTLCLENENPIDILKCVAANLRSVSKDERNKFYLEMVYHILDEVAMKGNVYAFEIDLKAEIENVYSEIKKQTN